MNKGLLKLFSPKRASKVSIVPPVPGNQREGIAVVAIMRNEAANICDWLKFHKLAGVRNFILYDNGSQDNTIEVARSVHGIDINVIPWQLNATTVKAGIFLPPQIIAYCHAISCFGHKYRWMSFIDIDEYLVPKSKINLQECLAPLSDFSNVSLPWVMFGTNGHKVPPTKAIPYAYTQASNNLEGPLLNFKCIVDPCKVKTVSVHKFETLDMGGNTANDLGIIAKNKRRTSPDFISTSNLQLNRYYTKSKQDLFHKINSGAISGANQTQRSQAIMLKLRLIEQNSYYNEDAVQFLKRHKINTTEEFQRDL